MNLEEEGAAAATTKGDSLSWSQLGFWIEFHFSSSSTAAAAAAAAKGYDTQLNSKYEF